MLTAVNGYIDGNRVIVEENIADWQGRNVIVTILDSNCTERKQKTESPSDDEIRKTAARELAGMWKDLDNEPPVEKAVRNMRRGRRFDI